MFGGVWKNERRKYKRPLELDLIEIYMCMKLSINK